MTLKRPDGPTFNQMGQHDRDMVKMALRTGANRREVMGWLMAAGATVSAAGAIVQGASEALAATPKKGGSVRFAWDLHGPSDTLDPILFTSSLDYGRGRLTYNNLCRFNEDLTVGPELATEWEANKDATEWTFKLRKGVEFHDGSPLTADDVVYSMKRHMGEESPSKAKVLVASVTEWKKVDAHTVKATLDAPNAELPVILGTFHFKIVKERHDGVPGGRCGHRPVQAFGVQTRRALGARPQRRILERRARRPVYRTVRGLWHHRQRGPRQRADLRRYPDVGQPRSEGASARSKTPITPRVFAVPSGRYPTISCMLDREPGNNPDFVQGLKHLQRRDRILKVVQKDVGTFGNDQPVGPAYGAGWCETANDPSTYRLRSGQGQESCSRSPVSAVQRSMSPRCSRA